MHIHSDMEIKQNAMIRRLSSIIVFGGSIMSSRNEDIKLQVRVQSKFQVILFKWLSSAVCSSCRLFYTSSATNEGFPNEEEGKFYLNSVFS
jgi:hypothetical protein